MKISLLKNYYTRKNFPPLHPNQSFYLTPLKNDCLSFTSGGIQLYAKKIDDNKKPVKFKSILEAQRTLGIFKYDIIANLEGKTQSAGGYVFKKAKDIEDKDGIVIDEEMKKFIQEAKKFDTNTALYVKNTTNSDCVIRFNNLSEASRALRMDIADIEACLDGLSSSIKGRIFIRAEYIEDEKGKVIDKKMDYFLRAAKKYASKKTYIKRKKI